ncbi:MAG: ribosomal protein S18-alanine N-acetyltransferase [Lachnospiraceae bacterium]|nr:ribosomal protein S18-alanine N-acetyltransferase [Lachnospiraceae bacterium]
MRFAPWNVLWYNKLMEVVVRRLKEADLDELVDMENQSFGNPWSRKIFADLLDRDYCLYLVAEVDGRLAGCCGLTDSLGEGSIDKVVVREQYRNLGIGGRLLEALLHRGKARGIEAFTLEVRVGNEPAIHLYEKFGFVSEGIRPNFYTRPTEDAMIMWRREQLPL